MAQAASSSPLSPSNHLPSPAPCHFENNSDMIVVNIPTLQPQTNPVMASMEDSLAILEAKSHAVQQEYMKKEQDDKEMKNAYGRHVKSYVDWWMMLQAHLVDENPTHFQIPAFPITVVKVMIQKRGSDDIQGSLLGVSHFKQTISVLKHRHFNDQHQFPSIPEAQQPLCCDPCIRTCYGTAHTMTFTCVLSLCPLLLTLC